MKYERLIMKTINGYGISGELVIQKQPAVDIAIDSFDIVINRLAELEDKIERGELVDTKENHLIAISRASGKSSKQLETIDILAKYEQGMLVELPCRLGDDFWYITMIWDISGKFIGEIYHAKVAGFYIADGLLQIEDDVIFLYHNYGVDAFLSEGEAVKRLKELENERNSN